MGYTTEFEGSFQLNRPLDQETRDLIRGLSTTRRMRRDIRILATMHNMSEKEARKKFGNEGEFYFNEEKRGQVHDASVADYDAPPTSQPGLWCQWVYNDATHAIEWDGNEKFYHYVEWLKYLIDNILEPRRYHIEGNVSFEGEDSDDCGCIIVENNQVKVEYNTKGTSDDDSDGSDSEDLDC